MFDIIPNLLSTGLILFAIFASYKALLSASPAQLTPWLTYFVILTLFTTLESFVSFITAYIPFYAWFRLFVQFYLLLPGDEQGALFVYSKYVQPWIVRHDHDIEQFIVNAHEKARALGLGHLETAWDWIRVNVFGAKPAPPPSRVSSAGGNVAPPASTTYVSNLLSRFSLPAGVQNTLAGAATEILQQAAARNARDSAGVDSTSSASGSGMKKSRSELEFDNISHEDAQGGSSSKASGWGAWIAGAAAVAGSAKSKNS